MMNKRLIIAIFIAVLYAAAAVPVYSDTQIKTVELSGFKNLVLTQIELSMRYSERSPGYPRPETIKMFLVLSPTLDGAIGFVADRPGQASLIPIRGSLQGNVLELDQQRIWVAPLGALNWKKFIIEMVDSDDDGEMDFGRGQVSGQWERRVGKIVDYSDFKAQATANKDLLRPKVSILSAGERGLNRIEPEDEIRLTFTEPVYWKDLRVRARVRLNGVPLTGSLTPYNQVGDMVIEARFKPTNPLPADSEISLDLGGLKDLSGNLAVWDQEVLKTR
jgi:hypothetical protein